MIKKLALLLIAANAAALNAFSQTKTVTVDVNDVLNNNTKIVAYTSVGQSFFIGHQAGSGYANGLAIFSAITDNPLGTSNYFFDGSANGITNFRIRADGQGYFAGSVGIGTGIPGAKLSFQNIDTDLGSTGMTWYNPDPLSYGIYKTGGAWNSPNFQQLKLQFATGIILSPGNAYGKSYVEINGGGLRVTSGNVGIGTTVPDQLLTVNGNIHAKGVTIDLSIPGPDYVFEKNYKLRTLAEVKRYINLNKHLPEIASAANMKKDGINVSELNIKLLQKIEELTLYMIEKEKKQKELEERLKKLEDILQKLSNK